MMMGLTLLYVGAVLFVNGIWLLGKISNKEVSIINLLVGGLSFLIAIHLIFTEPSDSSSVRAGAFTLLFSFTYLWVGANQLLKNDGSGLGWFCLFVSITAAIIGIHSLPSHQINVNLWYTANWFAWSILWLSFFYLLAMAKPIKKSVATYTLFCSIFTGWAPGVMILLGIISI